MKDIKGLIAAVLFCALSSCTHNSDNYTIKLQDIKDTVKVPEMIICFPGGSGDTSNVDTTDIYPTR